MRSIHTAGFPRLSRIPLAALLAAGLLLSAAGAAGAAETRTRSAFADTTKPVMFLKETVVTGSRIPRAYYDSPQALSFVSRRTLTEEAPVVLGDVLALVPGVDSNKDSPWEQRPSIRGLTGQRVLVLVDGTPMNSARGNGPHSSLVDPAQVERIEVVRGPSSVSYGSDALGGVINIITRQPGADLTDHEVRGTATLGGSVEGLPERDGSLNLETRWSKLGLFLSGGGRKADDYKTADGTVPKSGFSDWNGLANLRYDFTERLALTGGYQLYRGSNIGIPGLDVSQPGFNQEFNFKHYDRDFAHVGLEHRYPASSWLASAQIKTYWQREKRNFWSDMGFSAPIVGQYFGPDLSYWGDDTDRFFDLNTYGVQAQMTSRKTTHYRFTSGVDLTRDVTGGTNSDLLSMIDTTGTTVFQDRTPSSSVPSGRFDNYAGYLQGEFYLTPQWTLNAGGRYTHYRYRTDVGLNGIINNPPAPPTSVDFPAMKLDDDALSGSIGLVYSPIEDLHLSANVANGYREPNAQDLYFSGPGSVGYVVGNPSLKPERSVSYDAGLRWGPGDFAFSGSVFYSTFNDLIDAIEATTGSPLASPGSPTYQYVNITKARMYGGEVEAEWRFLPQWRARTALSTTVGDVTSRAAIQTLFGVDADQVPLQLVPPFGGSASLRWTETGGRLWAEAGTRFARAYDRLPPPTPNVEELSTRKAKWMVADLSAGVRLETGQRVEVGVRNVADQRYRPALASVLDPGRTFYTMLSSDF